MKHLKHILALSLLACASFAQTPNEELYAPYMVECTVHTNGVEAKVLVAHAWLEVNDAHLDVKIPAARILQRWNIVSEDVTLRDFALIVRNLEGPTSLIAMSARDFRGGRKSWTTADDLHNWVTEVLPFGYKREDLLTDAQAGAMQ